MGDRAAKLETRYVEKPWGRTELPATFGDTGGRRIGEIWFADDKRPDLELLVKYIFTSERLSIQVHPNDEHARALGLPRGKNECWYILDAEPEAVLGLGLKEPAHPNAVRAAATDGSIEAMIDWRPVRPGDFIYVPAGTIHAIGPGLSLLEVQQNSDVTYRLYDYGRPRELHLDEGMRVAKPLPYPDEFISHAGDGEDRVLINGPHFTLMLCSSPCADADELIERERWAMPIAGRINAGSASAGPGECLLLPPGEAFEASADTRLIVAAAGSLG